MLFLFISCSQDKDEVSCFGLTKSSENLGVVYGVVFDSESEMPISGVTVSIYPSGRRIVTGSDGQYEFQNLTDNNYVIQVVQADYASTADAIKLRGNTRLKNDIRMRRGQNTLSVDENEISISNVDSRHSLLISNTSNKTIKWNLSYDDYMDPATGMVHIYMSEWEGELQPFETKEIFIGLTVSGTLDSNYAFPLILQAGIEKIGIVIVPFGDGGKIYSKIIGKWNLYRTGHYEDGLQVRHDVPSDAYVLIFKDDLKYEFFNNYATIWFDYDPKKLNLQDIWHISYSFGSYTYNPAEKILFLGESFSQGFYWKLLNVTDYEMIIGSSDFDENKKEGAIYFYTKD